MIILDIQPIVLSTRHAPPNQAAILLDSNNKCVTKIQLKGPSVIKLMNVWPDSSASYIALPGTDISFHFDGLKKDTTRYRDVGSVETEFYINAINKSNERLGEIPQQDPVMYLKLWNESLHAMLETVRAAEGAGMLPAYASWISESITSVFQTGLCRQLKTYVTLTRRWPSNMKEYEDKIGSISLAQFNQPGRFNRETDKELVESYYLYHSLLLANQKKLPAPDAETTYRDAISAATKVRAESTREIMIHYLVSSGIAYTTDTVFLDWILRSVAFGKQNRHLAKMVAEKQAMLRKIGQNKPAPYFEGTDLAGNKFSFENYKGNYLYIDIWATWCMPCKKEIPYLEQLKKEYAGLPIEFISVSIDKTVGAWKKFVETTGSGKDQFLSVPGKASSINGVYHAQYIPAFVLIDPGGKIVNPHCYRPSDPALRFLLNGLLKTKMIN